MSQVDAWSTPGNKGIIEASATCAREMARFLVQRLSNDPPNGANWTASCPPALDLPAPTAGTTCLSEETAELIVRLAERTAAGYRRIHGELATMSIPIAPLSVGLILKRHV